MSYVQECPMVQCPNSGCGQEKKHMFCQAYLLTRLVKCHRLEQDS